MKNFAKLIGIIALVAVIALSMTACPTDGGGGGGDSNSATYTGYDSEGKLYSLVITKGDNTPGNKDSRLVTASTQAWIDSYPAGERDGWIFNANGVVQVIDDYTGTTSGTFKVQGSGTWTTSGDNSLTVIGNGVSETYSYTVSANGNTLTLTRGGNNQAYTKTTITVSGRSALSPSPAGPPAGNTGTKAVSAIKGAAGADLSRDSGRATGRAADTPQSGDKFTLTIKNSAGTTIGTSKGIISDIKNGAAEDTYTLDHEDGDKFTAKLKGNAIAEIPATDRIPLDGGDSLPGPGLLYPTKPAPDGSKWKWTFVEDRTIWDYTGESGNTYKADIYSIAYGGGTLVAGGGNGKMAYSTDNGVTWTAVADSKLGIYYIRAIAYGNGKFVAGSSVGTMAYSDDGVTWTAVTDSKFSYGVIMAIAYGGNKFVAGGQNGQMAYSADGASWTAVEIPSGWTGGNYVRAIAYGGGKWVAGYGSQIAYSSDGVTWTTVAKRIFIDSSIDTIAYGNGRFVARDWSGYAAYSTDGENWTNTGPSAAAYIIYCAAGSAAGMFISPGTGRTSFSSDGINWAGVTSEFSPPTENLNSGIYATAYDGNSRFVTVGYNGKIAYADWNGGDITPAKQPPAIITASLHDGIVGTAYSATLEARGYAPVTWSISAGALPTGLTLSTATGDITGTPTTANTYNFTVKAANDIGSVTKALSIIIAPGAGPVITTATLPDGTAGTAYRETALTAAGDPPITWSISAGALPTGLSLSTYGVITGMPTAAGTFNFTVKAANNTGNSTKALSITIAPGNGPTAWIAAANTTLTSSIIYAVAYGGAPDGTGKFVAGAEGGILLYSDDGTNWTRVANSPFSRSTYAIKAIAYGGGKFVAVGEGEMAYSDNGVNWTAVPDSASYSDFDITGIAYGGGRFVAVGTLILSPSSASGHITYSTDGANWTAAGNGTFGDMSDMSGIFDIAYEGAPNGAGMFIAVGMDVDVNGTIYTSIGKMARSTDGVTWTAVSSSVIGPLGKIGAIAYGGGRWIAGGMNNGKMAYSTDGASWTAVADSKLGTSINSITYGNNMFVAVGGGTYGSNSMAYSIDGASWTNINARGGLSGANAVTYGNGRFVAVSGSGSRIAYCDW